MAIEIERKFLVKDETWRIGRTGEAIRQGYLCAVPEQSVRVRTVGRRAFLTIKAIKGGFSRYEYEYEIPLDDASEMLDRICERPLIEKTRYTLDVSGLEWTVDVFSGDNEGLVVAEVELEREDQEIEIPRWAGREVTGEPRFLNANLFRNPYAAWPAEDREARAAGDRRPVSQP